MLRLAKKSCNEVMKVDITRGLPFKNDSLNFILCSDVLEHVDNPRFVISEIYRIIRSGKNVTLKIPNGLFDFMFILEGHKRLFTNSGFEKICRNVGFKLERKGQMGIIPFIRKVINFPQEIAYVFKK